MRIALIGAGSLGTVMGALITKNGGNIVLVDANEAHVKALNENGATVIGEMDLKNVEVNACLPENMTGKFDIVLLLVKAVYNDKALTQLTPHLQKESVVCTLQNGIPEDEVASYVGKERVVGGTVGWGATWQGPGVSKITTDKETVLNGAFEIGEVDGSITERIKKLKKVLESVGRTEIVTNLMGYRWTKLFINATLSGMSVALGCPYSGVLDNEKALTCAVYIGNELLKIAKAKGIKVEPFQGNDLTRAEFDDKDEIPEKLDFYKRVFSPHRTNNASMLNDLRNGIFNTEIDYINGKVVEQGEKLGIPTPFNKKVVEIVKNAQVKKEVTSFDNLDRFEIP